MAKNGQLFLEKVLNIINEESGENTLLIQFKHPKELKVSLHCILLCVILYFSWICVQKNCNTSVDSDHI